MKIALYIEHGSGDGVGGAELMMATTAAAWSRRHDVHLIHHRPPLTRERLQSFTDDDLSRLTIRAVPREPDAPAVRNLVSRYREAARWHQTISAGYDLLVTCTHWLPPFSHAARGVLLVLFPFYVPPFASPETASLPALKRLRHRVYYEFEWRRRMATYRGRVAISEYARRWTELRWGVDCEVIAPPVDVTFERQPKEQRILSVGRFSTAAHTKKQAELISVFGMLGGSGSGWRYSSVGGLNSRQQNHDYFAQVRQAGMELGADVEANLSRSALKCLYERSSIYWHATGFGDDTERRPELAEHFGISTVEAMAAGCVPVVINKGGQAEIVTHGVTGFLWNTLEELRDYTRQLMRDPALRERMSEAAQERARRFSTDRFLSEMSRQCGVGM